MALAAAALLCCLWAAPAFAETYGTVFGGWLRLRANPSYYAAVITSYRTGTVVTVLSRNNGWARVITPDYRIGYMDTGFLRIGSSKPTEPPYPSGRVWTDVNRTAQVISQNGKGVRLRSSPTVNNTNVMGLYPVGRTVREIRRSNDGWSYISIDGKHGYMMSEFLTTSYILPTPTPKPTKPPKPTDKPTKPPKPTDKPTNKPTDTPTPSPTPTPTPTPTPERIDIESVKLEPFNPTVGDTVKIIVSPSNAEYTAVWYRDGNVLLGMKKEYTVQAADAGKVIYVTVTGVGKSSGFSVEAYTGTVQAPPEEGGSDDGMTSEWVDP